MLQEAAAEKRELLFELGVLKVGAGEIVARDPLCALNLNIALIEP